MEQRARHWMPPKPVGDTCSSIVPQREFWLHKNPKAKVSVFRGLMQAKTGTTVKIPPDLKADARLAEQLND